MRRVPDSSPPPDSGSPSISSASATFTTDNGQTPSIPDSPTSFTSESWRTSLSSSTLSRTPTTTTASSPDSHSPTYTVTSLPVHHGDSKSAIIGGVIGGIAALSFLALAASVCYRRHRRLRDASALWEEQSAPIQRLFCVSDRVFPTSKEVSRPYSMPNDRPNSEHVLPMSSDHPLSHTEPFCEGGSTDVLRERKLIRHTKVSIPAVTYNSPSALPASARHSEISQAETLAASEVAVPVYISTALESTSPPGDPTRATSETLARTSLLRRTASSLRSIHSPLDTRSSAPAYSEIQSLRWETATHQERVQGIERMHSWINSMENSQSQTRQVELENEIAMLRAYVAQLETQLYAPWMASDNDEPPPEY